VTQLSTAAGELTVDNEQGQNAKKCNQFLSGRVVIKKEKSYPLDSFFLASRLSLSFYLTES
jgi:hypothetical protein